MADFRTKALNAARKYKIAGKVVKLVFNLSAVYKRTGGKVTYVSEDLKEIRIKIPLNRKTRNYVGTIFGGSQFAATDPIYMFQLINLLGDEYVVWDKSSTIDFKKPGKTTLHYSFVIKDELLDTIKQEIANNGKYVFELPIELKDEDNETVSILKKTIYSASKAYYKSSRK